ncbi:hypothetical protein L873DRAFT_1796395 [Choiromyces venosus 120613-1]|uniref:RING-type domain-containing protein n=1 Tax=Choiromyces venosus 120613-1 TaxID=1336337 RepID=A0A3N4IT20_9PEZI|nr:hypothetical protein L873DRAFT_1796395 [Choiromyces venosus 120613-1]
MESELDLLSSEGWSPISSENELYESAVGLDLGSDDSDNLVPLTKPPQGNPGELPVETLCMVPTSVREYTKEKGRGKEKFHEERCFSSSMEKFQYWQDKMPLCQDICIWFNTFIASFFCLGPSGLLALHMMVRYEPMPAYDCPLPNFGDPQFGICNWMWGSYANEFADVNVPEEVRRILGDSPTAVLTMKFFAFIRTGYNDFVGTESFKHDLLQGGWNMALQKPPKQKGPISVAHTDGLPTGNTEVRTSSSDDYSIGCLSPTSSAFLGLYGHSEFGSHNHGSRESSSGQRTQLSYARAPDYSNLGPFRLPKNPNRLTDPSTTGAQQHAPGDRRERERQHSPEWGTYDPWDKSNKTKERMRSISAPPSARSSGSHLSFGSWPSVSDSVEKIQSGQSLPLGLGCAEELSLNSSSIYRELGGNGYKARYSLPVRAPRNRFQGSGALVGRPKNNLSILVKHGELSARSGCTSFHTAVTSNGPLETQHGLLRFRMELDGSSARVIDDSDLRFEPGKFLKNIRHQAGAYIEPDQCAICYEDWIWKKSLEVAKIRDDRKWVLARLPCGHCFHGVCLAFWFSQISLTTAQLLPLLTLFYGRCNCPYCRATYLSWEHPWVNLLVQEGNSLGRYPNSSISSFSTTENIPNAAPVGASPERPTTASHITSDISGGHLGTVGSDVIQSSAGWSTVTESTQRTVLRRRRRVSQRQSGDYITNDSLVSHPNEFSSLGSLQLATPPDADCFEDEYWERYNMEIGEEGEGGWRDLGQLVGEKGIFGGSMNTGWPHLESYTNSGICGEPFRSELRRPVSRNAVAKSSAPPRLRALLLAAKLLESVSSELAPTSPTHLSLLDSAIVILDQFIQAHKEVYNEVRGGYTNSCLGKRFRNTSLSDQGSFFGQVGHKTKERSGNHSLCRYPNTKVATCSKGSSIAKSRVSSAEDTTTESIASLTAAPECGTYPRTKQARRRGQFGFLDKGSSFNSAAPGFRDFSVSGIMSHNLGGIYSDIAVASTSSGADTKTKATTAEGSLSSSDCDQFPTAVASPVTRMKLPFSPDINYPKSQEIEVQVRRINNKGSKIPVLVKKAGRPGDTAGRPWNMVTPISWNRENSPFNSAISVSPLRRPFFEKKSTEECDGSPTMRKIGSRLSNESMF